MRIGAIVQYVRVCIRDHCRKPTTSEVLDANLYQRQSL